METIKMKGTLDHPTTEYYLITPEAETRLEPLAAAGWLCELNGRGELKAEEADDGFTYFKVTT